MRYQFTKPSLESPYQNFKNACKSQLCWHLSYQRYCNLFCLEVVLKTATCLSTNHVHNIPFLIFILWSNTNRWKGVSGAHHSWLLCNGSDSLLSSRRGQRSRSIYLGAFSTNTFLEASGCAINVSCMNELVNQWMKCSFLEILWSGFY